MFVTTIPISAISKVCPFGKHVAPIVEMLLIPEIQHCQQYCLGIRNKGKLKMASNATVLIAVDPGASGCLCVGVTKDGAKTWDVTLHKMPETTGDLKRWADDLKHTYGKSVSYKCHQENVGFHIPGNSATASVKFAKHVGELNMLWQCFDIPVTLITPTKWMRALGCPNHLEKAERKRWIKAKVQQLYPDKKVTLDLADGLGIFHACAFLL
jgi:hypothetical protein